MTRALQNDGYSGLLNKVAGVDLFAVEAHFHWPCFSKFYSKHQTWKGYHRASNADVDLEMLVAHATAYGSVKSFIQKRNNYPLACYVLKCSSWPLYLPTWARKLSQLTLSLWEVKKLHDVTTFIREVVLKAVFKSSKEMPWPPTIEDIEKMSTEKFPEEVERFLNLGNEPNTEKCERTKRFAYSISQDVCSTVYQEQAKLSKHILICVTVRHLNRSKQLTTILNRLCHCELYSFGLETAIDEANTYLTQQIVTWKDNLLFHNEWTT